MPDYTKPSGRDLTDNILARLAAAEKKIRHLEGSPKRSAFDRGDTAAIPAPLEGQTMIQYDTDAAQYYSSGAWRTFGGGGPAVAFGQLEILDSSYANSGGGGYSMNSVDLSASGLVTTDASVFDTVTVGGIGGLQLKVAGQYLVTASVFGEAFVAPAAGSFVRTSTSSTIEANYTDLKVGGWVLIDAFGDYQASAAHQIIASVGEISSPVPRNVFLRAGQNSGAAIQIHATLTAILLTSNLLV